MRRCVLGLLLLLGAAGAADAQTPSTLGAVRERGELRCGVFGQLPGFSAPDAQGVMSGLDADFCRALAAAILGDATKVRFVTADSVEAGMAGLESGAVDVLSSNLTATAGRNAGRRITSTAVLLYDGQGLLVRADAGIHALAQLDGKRVCVAAAEVNASQAILADAARRAGIAITPVPTTASGPALLRGFLDGSCDAVTADAAALATLRVTDLPDPNIALLLPERLSREPLSPYVRDGDDAWRQIVTWTIHALVAAEELGVTSITLDAALQSDNAETRFLLGLDRGLGAALGLEDTWAAEAVRQVGNYGEIFERNLGEGSPIGLDRGLSDLWLRGGLMYPPPFR